MVMVNWNGSKGWDVASTVHSMFVTSRSRALKEYSASACMATTVSCGGVKDVRLMLRREGYKSEIKERRM